MTGEAKQRCAYNLARYGARGDKQLNIYIDYLQRVANPASETAVLNILTNVCNVNFASDTVSIRQAGKVAERLIARRISVVGLQTALGLHSLLIEKNPSQAVKHFSTAFQGNRRDRVALVGLLATSVQNGTYADVADIGSIYSIYWSPH